MSNTATAKNQTRAFLLGGPVDGRVLILEGAPQEVSVPECIKPTALDYGPTSAPEALKVHTYTMAGGPTSHDGKTIKVYVHKAPTPRFRHYVVLAGTHRAAVEKLRSKVLEGTVPPHLRPHSPEVSIVTNRHDAYRLRGMRGRDVALIYGYGALDVRDDPEVRMTLNVLLWDGAKIV